jgi:hypothetical protein
MCAHDKQIGPGTLVRNDHIGIVLDQIDRHLRCRAGCRDRLPRGICNEIFEALVRVVDFLSRRLDFAE